MGMDARDHRTPSISGDGLDRHKFSWDDGSCTSVEKACDFAEKALSLCRLKAARLMTGRLLLRA